ncbi:hypothetical protein [Nocardia sp. NBC_01009]|uniref:hypothetical protein n=1 Tax=Nocardia sp. NBC_01009 TaxID=2975996 RepID=UPI003863903B|nr:hypothetical protein OHA42_34770 [Nocardia sp. NBC_01009]
MPIDLSFFRSETSQRIRAEGYAIGFAEGRARSILHILDRRDIAVPDDVGFRITACRDHDQVDRWLDRCITATTITDLFSEET